MNKKKIQVSRTFIRHKINIKCLIHETIFERIKRKLGLGLNYINKL